MKRNQYSSSFQGGSRRRSAVPLIPIIMVVILIAIIALLWSRGGEQPQARVEKVIPAEKLGQ
jgi:hypothetical protein